MKAHIEGVCGRTSDLGIDSAPATIAACEEQVSRYRKEHDVSFLRGDLCLTR